MNLTNQLKKLFKCIARIKDFGIKVEEFSITHINLEINNDNLTNYQLANYYKFITFIYGTFDTSVITLSDENILIQFFTGMKISLSDKGKLFEDFVKDVLEFLTFLYETDKLIVKERSYNFKKTYVYEVENIYPDLYKTLRNNGFESKDKIIFGLCETDLKLSNIRFIETTDKDDPNILSINMDYFTSGVGMDVIFVSESETKKILDKGNLDQCISIEEFHRFVDDDLYMIFDDISLTNNKITYKYDSINNKNHLSPTYIFKEITE